NTGDKMIKVCLIQNPKDVVSIAEIGDHGSHARAGKELRKQFDKCQDKAKERGGGIERICFPTRLSDNLASDGITNTKMKKQGGKERERKIVEQIDCEVEVATYTNGPVNVENKCSQANIGKMEDKWRRTTLLKEHKYTDPKPDQANYGQKDDGRRPSRNR